MKSFRFLFLGLMTLSIVLVGCKDDDPANPVDVIEDGIYLVGSNVASEKIEVESRMQPGWIEKGFDAELKSGLYQQVLFISATGTFNIVEVKGDTQTTYGATTTVDPEISWAFSGDVVQDGSGISVAENGLYFVYLDFQAASKKIYILKSNEIGLIGDGVGSGSEDIALPKKGAAFSKTECEWEKTGVTFYNNWWKVRKVGEWKYVIAEDFVVLTNLGGDFDNLFPGGPNLPNVPRGIYTVNLRYEYGEGFKMTTTKTGDVAIDNYTDCELELIGSGIDESNPGAQPDEYWGGWGFVVSAGKPVKTENVYTWTWNSVILKAEGFKIRTLNAAASGGINGFDLGFGAVENSPSVVNDEGNLKVSEAGNYKIVVTIDAEADTKKIVVTKL